MQLINSRCFIKWSDLNDKVEVKAEQRRAEGTTPAFKKREIKKYKEMLQKGRVERIRSINRKLSDRHRMITVSVDVQI